MKKFFSIQSFFFPIIFAIVLPALISCSKANMNTTNPINIPDTVKIDLPKPDTSKIYLALGDSYTIGQSVTEPERFPSQTVSLLRAQNIKINDPKIIATTGWTT